MTTPGDELVPSLRGVSHVFSFWVALVAAVVLVVIAPDSSARTAAAIYGAGLCALFGGSGLYHRWRWDPRWRPLLRRIDHSTIFFFIAASYTPVALLVLEDSLQVTILVIAWAGALAGVAFSLVWIEAPRWLVAATYLGLGWISVIALPELVDRLSAPPLILIGAGGLLYTTGAIVYALKRPNPWPATFGFHEVFHTLVVLAALAHFVAMAGWIVTS